MSFKFLNPESDCGRVERVLNERVSHDTFIYDVVKHNVNYTDTTDLAEYGRGRLTHDKLMYGIHSGGYTLEEKSLLLSYLDGDVSKEAIYAKFGYIDKDVAGIIDVHGVLDITKYINKFAPEITFLDGRMIDTLNNLEPMIIKLVSGAMGTLSNFVKVRTYNYPYTPSHRSKKALEAANPLCLNPDCEFIIGEIHKILHSVISTYDFDLRSGTLVSDNTDATVSITVKTTGPAEFYINLPVSNTDSRQSIVLLV